MKCVMIINQNLPLGLIANTAAVLAISIGHTIDGIVGEDVQDKDGSVHRGITQATIPLLKGDSDLIRAIREKLVSAAPDDVYYVDFCDVAQKSKHYADYKASLSQTPGSALQYLGIAIYGPTKKVTQLTGSIGLLR